MSSNPNHLGLSADGTISYGLLPQEKLQEALDLLENNFYPYESLCFATQVSKNPKVIRELNSLVKECFKDDLSIAAIEIKTNKLVGCSVNRINKRTENKGDYFGEKFIKEKCKEDISVFLSNPFLESGINIDLFDIVGVDQFLEFTFVTTSVKHRRRGIGTDLIKYSLELLDSLADNKGPCIASVYFTSYYSHRIGEKFNFINLLSVDYDLFSLNGIRFSDVIDKKNELVTLAIKYCKTKSIEDDWMIRW